MPEHHRIEVPRTAHYYTLGPANEQVRRFWIVCHGYGQLASSFIRRFEGLDDGRTLVLAPEGLSYFYWGGFSGEPVASWMTRHHRLDEIRDYARYLQMVYDRYVPRLHPDVEINLLGFSQGVATQLRWIMAHFPRFHNLLLWAGMPPEDLDYRPHEAFFGTKRILFVYGRQDPFLTEERLQWVRTFAKEQFPVFEEHAYDGVHEVDPAVLQTLAKGLGRKP
ncbi:MAG: esterase [Saprospiraceae bacterium]|nr:MAG: esterase [Saprospiraceae bacterium]